MDWLLKPEALAAFATLTAMEIVLGIDNIIFISVLAGRLPLAQQPKARRLGLAAALISRLALLFSITWIMRLSKPLFTVFEISITGRDLILIIGGLFLMWKATREIHHKVEGVEESHSGRPSATLQGVILQVLVIDVVFSLDSVITAVGMVDDIRIMMSAVVVSVGVMLFAAGPISAFVDRHPTVKMLALAFLLMIGMMLVAEGWHFHVPKGYVYFAMAFSILVELLNIRASAKRKARDELATTAASGSH